MFDLFDTQRQEVEKDNNEFVELLIMPNPFFKSFIFSQQKLRTLEKTHAFQKTPWDNY